MTKWENVGMIMIVILILLVSVVIFLVTRTLTNPCIRECYKSVAQLEEAYNCGLDEGIVCCDKYEDKTLRNYCITGALDKIRPKAVRTNIDGVLDSLRNFCIKACKTREIKNDKK